MAVRRKVELRNDSGAGRGPRFVDVTERSGLAVAGYGSGAVAGDYDGDGFLDLYVTAFGANQLFRNGGDGTFTDVTAAAGVGETLWSMGAAFADVDGDGFLDLYVANYVDFGFDNHILAERFRTNCFDYSSYRGSKSRTNTICTSVGADNWIALGYYGATESVRKAT